MSSDSERKNIPAFQFYPEAWLADERVCLLSDAQEGIYIRLLCYCWREGSIPGDSLAIARLCKRDSLATDIDKVVSTFFFTENGRLRQKRLDEERNKQRERRQKMINAGKLGAKNRWAKGDGVANGVVNGVAMQKPIAIDSSLSLSLSLPLVPSSKEEATIQASAPKAHPERFPSPIVEGCVYFRMCEKEKELVKVWYKKNQFPVELIPEAVAMVENWMVTGSKAGARAARKLPTHFKHCYATWVLDKLGDVASARRRLNGTSQFQTQQTQRSPHTRTFKGPLPAFPGSPKGEAK